MRLRVRAVVALTVAMVGLVAQAGASGAVSTVTGTMTGVAASLDFGCDVNWYVPIRVGLGGVVFRADGSVVAPLVDSSLNLIGAFCGAQVGEADVGVTWETNDGSQLVDCTGRGGYTFQRHTSLVAIRASVNCTWYNFKTHFASNFVGQLSGYVSPGALGHAVEVFNLA